MMAALHRTRESCFRCCAQRTKSSAFSTCNRAASVKSFPRLSRHGARGSAVVGTAAEPHDEGRCGRLGRFEPSQACRDRRNGRLSALGNAISGIRVTGLTQWHQLTAEEESVGTLERKFVKRRRKPAWTYDPNSNRRGASSVESRPRRSPKPSDAGFETVPIELSVVVQPTRRPKMCRSWWIGSHRPFRASHGRSSSSTRFAG